MFFKKIRPLFLCTVLLFSSCGKTNTIPEVEPEDPEIIDPELDPDQPIDPPSEPDIHTNHRYWHYNAVAPTCTRNGSKEYWICTICNEVLLEIPQSGEVTDKGSVVHNFSSDDVRYVAPVAHDLHHYDEVDSTYTKYGMKEHYECSSCQQYFDTDYNLVSVEDLRIPKKHGDLMTIVDSICSDEESIKSGASWVREGFESFSHVDGTNTISTNGNAGWQLTKEKYTDLDMKLRIDGAGRTNPTESYVTKGFIIGGDASNQSTRYEGVIGAMPTGYLISVFHDENAEGQSYIQIFRWQANDCDYQKGTLLGCYKGDLEGKYFYVHIKGQYMTIDDENGNNLMLTPADNLNHFISSIYLRGYQGGSVGIYSWTNTGEVSNSTFYLEDFNGVVKKNKDSGYSFVQTMLDSTKSISSTDPVINQLTNSWIEGEDKFTIDAKNGYDSTAKKGSWRLTKKTYNNLKFATKITNCTTTNPYGRTANSCTSILLGATPTTSGEYFKGYSITVFYKETQNSDGTIGVSHWVEVHYHDNSVAGTFIGGINYDLHDTEFYFTVTNKYLRLFNPNGVEIFGKAYWPNRVNGLYLENYEGGSLGILKWDETETQYSIYDIEELDDVCNPNYEDQDTSKRINLFLLIGQSNMEGNTKSAVRTNYYLKNYCEATSSLHNYENLMNGFDNVQIAVHNNYMPNYKHYYTNENAPMTPKFEATRVGMGVTTEVEGYTYFGPELGFAEKLSAVNASEANPIFLVKYASGGTGFNTNNDRGWLSPTAIDGGSYLYSGAVQYMKNCIESIKAMGYIPILKGVLWMQGCSDSGSMTRVNAYQTQTNNLISDIRTTFASYAVENKAMNINFIDAGVFEGVEEQKSNCTYPVEINNAKRAVAALEETNYFIDTNCDELRCITNNGGNNGYGGGDGWHYSADSMIKLGNAFADVVLNNNILKF